MVKALYCEWYFHYKDPGDARSTLEVLILLYYALEDSYRRIRTATAVPQ